MCQMIVCTTIESLLLSVWKLLAIVNTCVYTVTGADSIYFQKPNMRYKYGVYYLHFIYRKSGCGASFYLTFNERHSWNFSFIDAAAKEQKVMPVFFIGSTTHVQRR